ncbi:MAG TPA: ethylbenzene dehydrogenase-related protein [Usitatibacteraceae bacterium]|nr:ethylbenzene dehydrogenase-related protein [Usitatibacteraceae bacterium]
MNSRTSRIARWAPLACAMALAVGGTAFAQNTLTAKKVAQAPVPAALAADPAWNGAEELKIKLNRGANFGDGTTQATFKAAYTADMLYLLVSWNDPTQSVRRFPYVKQADGSWKMLRDPNDKGGDDNVYYEDKFAFIWNINNSIKAFRKEGCFAACHENEAPKPYGNKYTESEGELGDIWHMKSIRGGYIGQTDDQYLDHTRFDKEKAKEAGRKSDPKTGGGYADIKLVNGKPEFMNKDGKSANKGGSYYLREEDKVAFDDARFAPGDEVASILVSKFTGDRGDLDTVIGYKDGRWTAVIARKLVTGSKFDVQFDKLDAEYLFGFAAFDNAQVRHAYHKAPVRMVFGK